MLIYKKTFVAYDKGKKQTKKHENCIKRIIRIYLTMNANNCEISVNCGKKV